MPDLARYAGLQRVSTFPLPTFVSAELVRSVSGIAFRFEQASQFFGQLFTVRPGIGLVVLSAQDWPHYAALPVFGVTHYDYPRHMIVTAAEPSTFWHPAVERIRTASPQLISDLQAMYMQSAGDVDLTPHINLWLSHDIGHAFHLHAGYWFPRRWLMEYFADLCSYASTATYEPNQLPALDTFPRVLRVIDASHMRYHTLHDFEAHYGDGAMSLENYLWYHGYLYEAAQQAYQLMGTDALRHMWEAFVVANVEDMSDDQLAQTLRQVQPHLAHIVATLTTRFY
jgi:hypothetical protein